MQSYDSAYDMLPEACVRPKRCFSDLVAHAMQSLEIHKSHCRDGDDYPRLITIVMNEEAYWNDPVLHSDIAEHEDDASRLYGNRPTLISPDHDKTTRDNAAACDSGVTESPEELPMYSYIKSAIPHNLSVHRLLACALPTDDALHAWIQGLNRPALLTDVMGILLDQVCDHGLIERIAHVTYHALQLSATCDEDHVPHADTQLNFAQWIESTTFKICRDHVIGHLRVSIWQSDDANYMYCRQRMAEFAVQFNARHALQWPAENMANVITVRRGTWAALRFWTHLYGARIAHALHNDMMQDYRAVHHNHLC